VPTETIAQRYLAALESGRLDEILALFHPEAEIFSPLYGRNRPQEFVTRLLGDTSKSKLTHYATFSGSDPSGTKQLVALYFGYEWHLRAGKVATFDIVDIFEMTEDGLIRKLNIVEDTAIAKPAFEAATGRKSATHP
jgi:hypothetical protein